MSTPVIEHIAQYMVTLVDGITVANGYNYDLTAVRPKVLEMNADLAKPNNVIISQGNPPKHPEPFQGSRHWDQPFLFRAIVYEDAVEIIDAKLNKIRSDIEKAIGKEETTPDADGKRCGGYAESLTILKPLYLNYEDFTGILVEVIVGYSVAEDDPYTVA